MTADIVVIGVGNPMRRDDGVGPAAIARLADAPDRGSDVELMVLDGESTRLLEAWRGRTLAIVVDATHTGDPDGTIHRIDIGVDPVPVVPTTSSHGAGVAQAVALARTLDALPDRLLVYGVEPGDLGMGEGLSPAVAAALPELVDRIEAELADVASSRRDAAIREAHRAGASLREIADASGISHMTVKRIIERTPE